MDERFLESYIYLGNVEGIYDKDATITSQEASSLFIEEWWNMIFRKIKIGDNEKAVMLLKKITDGKGTLEDCMVMIDFVMRTILYYNEQDFYTFHKSDFSEVKDGDIEEAEVEPKIEDSIMKEEDICDVEQRSDDETEPMTGAEWCTCTKEQNKNRAIIQELLKNYMDSMFLVTSIKNK